MPGERLWKEPIVGCGSIRIRNRLRRLLLGLPLENRRLHQPEHLQEVQLRRQQREVLFRLPLSRE